MLTDYLNRSDTISGYDLKSDPGNWYTRATSAYCDGREIAPFALHSQIEKASRETGFCDHIAAQSGVGGTFFLDYRLGHKTRLRCLDCALAEATEPDLVNCTSCYLPTPADHALRADVVFPRGTVCIRFQLCHWCYRCGCVRDGL